MRNLLAIILTIYLHAHATAAEKPNIIVILVDDMGYSDIGCYGGEIPTPHLDSLAKGGVRLTQFYNTGRCCPTRAALLTGVYSHQAGVGHMMENRGSAAYSGHLNDSCVTIAEVLKPAGYFTAMAGKWHVGHQAGVTPSSRGFERSLHAAAGGFYFPGGDRANLFLNGQSIANDDPRLPKNWYSTDLWTTFGLKFIDEATAAKKPFFLYLAHNAPHFPLQVPADEIAKFRGKYKQGWDQLRQERLARQVEMGLIDASCKPAPRPTSIKAWKNHSAEAQDRFDHLMAVYAATISRMDKAIGDLVEGLKTRGQWENTLILFMSDNGGNAESGPAGRNDGDPTQSQSNWFCGESWAFLQNTPFREYKHYNHEGGIATPLIAHWPKGITAQNTLRKDPAHLIDIMATCADVSHAEYPKEKNGKTILPPEGKSLKGIFQGEALIARPIFWEHEGNRAIRSGPWKLVSKHPGPWELYDISADRTEQNNLASQHPERVKELSTQWDAWASRVGVRPWPLGGGNAGKSPKVRKAQQGKKNQRNPSSTQ